MNIIQVKVPDIGDLDEVEIIELMVKVGDVIAKEQSLITVESDKASMEIPSSHAGTVQKIIVKVGDKVKLGSVVLELIETSAATVATIVPVVASTPVVTPAIAVEVVIPSSVPVVTPSVPTPAVSVEINANTDISKAHASPSVRAFARELGANLNQIKGTEEYGLSLIHI
jgi:pyruvate dehydrogenase E2 component (dihydrolipoamide acetyltransferase)